MELYVLFQALARQLLEAWASGVILGPIELRLAAWYEDIYTGKLTVKMVVQKGATVMSQAPGNLLGSQQIYPGDDMRDRSGLHPAENFRRNMIELFVEFLRALRTDQSPLRLLAGQAQAGRMISNALGTTDYDWRLDLEWFRTLEEILYGEASGEDDVGATLAALEKLVYFDVVTDCYVNGGVGLHWTGAECQAFHDEDAGVVAGQR